MRALRRAVGIAALAALLCASPAVAAGNAQGLPGGGDALVKLSFENRDGYKIDVAGFGQTVALSVISRRGDGSSSATYLAHGTVTPTSIQASFADRGRVALRFRPTGRKIRLGGHDSHCGPDRDGVVGSHGVFVGGLRFRGEADYTSVSVHRAGGASVDYRDVISCLLSGLSSKRHAALPAGRLPAGLPPLGLPAPVVHRTIPGELDVPTYPSPGPKATTLSADGKLPLDRTLFGARARGGEKPRFVAIDEHSEGSIAIVRYVTLRAAPATFVSDDALSLASVTPPPPFSGTGTWQRSGSEKSWTGSLAVSFLGAPHVPLTGSRFSSRLVRGW
jgi:hypothetical protein